MSERTCTSCRTIRGKSELIRFAERAREVVFDPAGTAPGRGAYTCRTESCIGTALMGGKLARSLRATITAPDAGRLCRQAVEYLLSIEDRDDPTPQPGNAWPR